MKEMTTKNILIGLLGLGMVFFLTSSYVHKQQSAYVAQMKLLIAQQETALVSIAELTDKNGADPVVASIIRDCPAPERQKFDILLGNLGTLNKSELIEINQLFNACGNFDSQRKALMIARLDREFKVYKDYVALLAIVDKRTKKTTYPVEKWEELVSLENKRSELFLRLVLIQEDIIVLLREDNSVQSEEVSKKVSVAQDTKDTMGYTGIKIDALRSDIIGL